MGLFSRANDWLAGLNDRFADDYNDDGTLKDEVVEQIKDAVKSGDYGRKLNKDMSSVKNALGNRRSVKELKALGAINQNEYDDMMSAIADKEQAEAKEAADMRAEAEAGDYS